ncbi:MAG: DUF839 domain-containing protein, partial [Betaproteobacteria bacterium]|nr:DUF839 domain-containing protein [Betaproteobacteria bacterium]
GTNNVFGQHVNYLGVKMENYSGADLTIGPNKGISSSPDHTTLLQRGGKIFSITQFEEYAGFAYITELAQNLTTGALTATATKPVDLSGVYGGWDFCAGVPTPWGSHLGGEEYPTDVRKFEAGDATEVAGFNAHLEYWGYDPTLTDATAKASSRTTALAKTSPYRVGYPVEIKITGDSLGSGAFAANTEATKHYAMGRIAWELAYVMPNKKTVYGGDDSTNKGMFRFDADTAGNLSSGTLYIAKLTQTTPKATTTESGEFDISWISLGSASNAEIDSYIKRGIKFADMFDYQAPAAGNATACATGYTATYANNVYECLKLKTTNDLKMSEAEIKTAASRLEALRYGAMLGGTAEFRKFEGVTFDPKRSKLYIAMSAIGSGMSSSPTLPGVSDDILIKANVCGGVYQLDVNSNYVTTRMTPLVAGIPKTYTDRPIQTNPDDSTKVTQQQCDDAGIALPDNVTMGPTNDILIIGEDATTEHQNDFLWAYNLETKTLTRIGSMPYGAEVTSPMYYRNINGWDYMTMVVQARPSGLLGPLPGGQALI